MEHAGSEFIIRRAKASDIDAIGKLLFETWHDAYDPIIGAVEVEKITTVVFAPQLLAHYARSSPISRLFVAQCKNQLAGVGQCQISMLGGTQLHMLYVHPEFQCRGLGTELLGKCALAFPWARTFSVQALEPNSRALSFYERHGFSKVGWHHNRRWASVPIVTLRRSLPGSRGMFTAFMRFWRLWFGLPMDEPVG